MSYEQEEVHLSRTRQGLEAFIPSGRPDRPGTIILVNDRYSATVDLGLGITSIQKIGLKDRNGQTMPPDEAIHSVSLESPDEEELPLRFQWKQ